MNLNGMVGDARKRAEQQDAEAHVSFDRHPECLLCGRRDPHTHVRQFESLPAKPAA